MADDVGHEHVALSTLRVCVVTPSYPPDIGGLAVLVARAAQGLKNVGCHVEIATQSASGTFQERLDTSGITVREFPNRLGGRRFGYAPGLTKWVRENQARFDLIHAYSYHAPVALATALTAKKPLFFTPTFHGGGHSPLASAVHLIYRPIAGLIFRRAERVFCGSAAERTSLLKEYPFCAQWTTVNMFAMGKAGTESVEPFLVPRPVILSAGRLDDYKRNDLLIRAMAHMEGRADLKICGSGPDRKRLEEIARECRVEECVQFLGYVSDEDLIRWQQTAAVVASMSLHESFGLSLAEGAVAGANVVASDIPAHREVAELLDVAASFVPITSSSRDVARALTEALDRPLRNSISTHQRTWTERALETAAVFERALAAPRLR